MRTWIVLIAIALLAVPACDDAEDGDDGEEQQQQEETEDDGESEGEDGDEADEVAEVEEVDEEEEDDGLQPVEGRIEISLELDDDRIAEAEELVEESRGGRFDGDEITVENAPLLMELAARNDEPEVVAEALRGLTTLYRPSDDVDEDEHLAVDDDFAAVVVAHLSSEDDQVLYRAIRASRHLLGEEDFDDDEVLEKLGHPASFSRPEVAYEVARVLGRVDDWQEKPQIVAILADGIEHDEAYVISETLNRMRFTTRFEDAGDELWEPVLAATEHDDPGVRGRAIEVLARLPGWGFGIDEERADTAGARALELLDDDHPFVRSRAAGAAARVDYFEAIPKLMTLVDDHERNTYDIDGWTRLNDSRGRLHHDGSAWSRVSDAALRALNNMRFDDRRLRFDYDSPSVSDDRDTEEQLVEQAEAAKEWFEENEEAVMAFEE